LPWSATPVSGQDPICFSAPASGLARANAREKRGALKNARYDFDTMQNSALGNLGRRVIAWIVIAAVAILAIKLIIGAVFGFITMILTLALIAVAIVGVMWALRHI
jgi:hypothetical protein